MTPDQRRMHFYKVFYEFRESFDVFIQLYKQYYSLPDRGKEYIRQGWRYNKLHEDYNEYQRESRQIKDDVSNGVYKDDWRRIILNLSRDFYDGKREKMESADIYNDTQRVLVEIQRSLNNLEESLKDESSNIRDAKEKNYADIAVAGNLQENLKQVMKTLENREKELAAESDVLKEKAEAGTRYAKGTGLDFSGNINTEPTNVNRIKSEKALVSAKETSNSRMKSDVTSINTGSENRSNKQAPKQPFSKICKEAGEQM